MGQGLIRPLRADEIECRIGSISEKGLSLLLYKDARVDQRILDETFGIFGWKRSHQCIDGNLYCTVEVRDRESGEWIAKQDVGTMGYAEKEKSQASDSFKRACFNWGIGRELYSAPFIWVPAGKAAIQKKEDRLCCYDRFLVRSIACNEEGEISALVIENDKGQKVYELKPKGAAASGGDQGRQERKTAQTEKKPQEGVISKDQMDSLQKELKRTGVAMETVQERYKIRKPEEMSGELYDRVMRALSRTKAA